MRQVLSWRFVAAIAALIGLALVVMFVFARSDSVAEIVAPTEPIERRADVVALVLDTQVQDFAVGPDGRSIGEVSMVLSTSEEPVTIQAGTPGINDCPGLGQVGQCALLAQLLGDAIISFRLIPMGPRFTFELPAIEALEGGYANLADGWQVPYASVIDRSACDSPADSFSEFLRLNPIHRSLYSLGENEIVSVLC
jgi:hypothetical protein